MALSSLKFLQIPTTSTYPAYVEKVSLDGTVYQLAFSFNDVLGCWMVDVQDINGNPLLASIPLLPSYPLNWRYAQRIPDTPPGIFYLVDETGQDRTPGLNDLGGDINLYYLQDQ